MSDPIVHIVGAGPASLIAAINLARARHEVIVHEQKSDVGLRFQGDFQGLENWSTEEDVLDFLHSIGVSSEFRCEPYSMGSFYGPKGNPVTIKSSRPLFYLVERGKSRWSIDQDLKRQALEAGVKIQWNDKLKRVPPGKVIVGTGPKAADGMAKGIVFQTSYHDACLGFLDDRIAPKGYAYLLVNRGKATFATCLFEDFKNGGIYFERALSTMRRVTNIVIERPKRFSGFGNFSLQQPVIKGGNILYVGENAGFQDALWGFGIRYAMLSGYLAAQSIMTGKSYDHLCHEKLRPMMETSLANRWLFAHLGDLGYEKILKRLSKVDDVIPALRKHYKSSWFKRTIFPLAKRSYHSRLIDEQCMSEHCDCVWCKHCLHELERTCLDAG